MDTDIYNMSSSQGYYSLANLPIFQDIKESILNSQNSNNVTSLNHMLKLQNNKANSNNSRETGDQYHIRQSMDEYHTGQLPSLASYNASSSQPSQYIRDSKGKIDHLRMELTKESYRREELRMLGANHLQPIGFNNKFNLKVNSGESEKTNKQHNSCNNIFESMWTGSRTANYTNTHSHLTNELSPFVIPGHHYYNDSNFGDENESINHGSEEDAPYLNNERNGPNFRFHESFQQTSMEEMNFNNTNILNGVDTQDHDEDIKEEEDEYYDDDDNAFCYDDDDDDDDQFSQQ